MSYLARLKQDIHPTNRAHPKTFEGFEGDGTRGFSAETPKNLPTFLAEKKESFVNQFYTSPQKSRHEAQPIAASHEIRPVAEPSEPSKGSDDHPEAWRLRFYALSSSEAPCSGFRLSMDWRDTFDAAHTFLEQHAEAAHALGWGALDLFAVHHVVGGARVDCCGAVMLMAGNHVASIERDMILLDRGRFFRTPHTTEMVPVWSFGR